MIAAIPLESKKRKSSDSLKSINRAEGREEERGYILSLTLFEFDFV